MAFDIIFLEKTGYGSVSEMLTVKNISKHYGDTAALSGISFHIAPGETTGIFGMPASGKTTLLDIISGYLLRYTGNVELCGVDLRKQPSLYRRQLVYIPAGGGLYPEMTVEEYALFVCGINCRQSGKNKKAVAEAMRFAGIEALAAYPIQSLNALDRAKVAVAAALATGPELLLIDQPFYGLRMDEIAVYQNFLKAVAQRLTLVVASDSISGFSEICKRTIILNKGKMASAAAENLFAIKNTGARIRLRIACAPSQIKAAFQFIPGILDVDFHSAPEKGVWDVVIDTEEGTDIRKQIWFAAATFKVPVLEMRYLHISPEDIFLQLTGQNQGEGR
jgi:ABC-2 type transport system ATP-binding protein